MTWAALCLTLCVVAVREAHARPSRVLLISIDGLRADAVNPTWTPTLMHLLAGGTYTLRAQCVLPSVTIPNHISMLTGLAPAAHGFRTDAATEGVFARHTILELVHRAGYTTALYLSKEKLRVLAAPGTLTRLLITGTGSSEEVVSRVTSDLTRAESRWTLSVVHLVEPDVAGHQAGWMTLPYQAAVRLVDRHVRRMLDALDAAGLTDQTLVIVTADHGGIDFHHVRRIPEVLSVPWIANGPGVPRAQPLERLVYIYDTAPTILAAFGLPIPRTMQGSPVNEALQSWSSTDRARAVDSRVTSKGKPLVSPSDACLRLGASPPAGSSGRGMARTPRTRPARPAGGAASSATVSRSTGHRLARDGS